MTDNNPIDPNMCATGFNNLVKTLGPVYIIQRVDN